MNTSRITLIGMAGIGKSRWAVRLEDRGYLRIDCDRMIAERLCGDIKGGLDVIAAMGSWMGPPWEPGYEENSRKYHILEIAVMKQVLENLAEVEETEKIVVDTAGSVVYIGDDLLEELAQRSLVVHLSSSRRIRERLLKDYLERPGPVLWQGMFRPRPGEALPRALARCYFQLLEDREHRYARWAHITVDCRVHRAKDADVGSILNECYKHMTYPRC